MGVSHLSPTATQNRLQEIVEYKGNHVDLAQFSDMDEFLQREEIERRENNVRDHFTSKYDGFRENEEWLGDHEKLLAETRHGVELRTLYHPSGTSQYFYLVVVTKEFEAHNLAFSHLQTYYNDLKTQLKANYGEVCRKTSAWTSEEVEV